MKKLIKKKKNRIVSVVSLYTNETSCGGTCENSTCPGGAGSNCSNKTC